MASVVAYTGLAPQVVDIIEADATALLDFYDGDLVKADGSGQIVIATTGAIKGIARHDAIAVDGSKIPVELINPNEIYVVKYSTVTATTLVGDACTFTFTKSAHTVTTGGTPGASDCYIVELHPDDAVGTDGGRVLIRFENSIFEGVA